MHPEVGLVFLDLMLPGMNGMEVLAAIRSDPVYADLPVIIQTGMSGLKEEQEQRLTEQATKVVRKPYTRKQILDVVEHYLAS